MIKIHQTMGKALRNLRRHTETSKDLGTELRKLQRVKNIAHRINKHDGRRVGHAWLEDKLTAKHLANH